MDGLFTMCIDDTGRGGIVHLLQLLQTISTIEQRTCILQRNDIKMGRDALFNLLRCRGLLVRKTKRFHITTDSKHFYYTSPKLIKELQINHCEQVFVSDITYIKTDEGHAYLAL